MEEGRYGAEGRRFGGFRGWEEDRGDVGEDGWADTEGALDVLNTVLVVVLVGEMMRSEVERR